MRTMRWPGLLICLLWPAGAPRGEGVMVITGRPADLSLMSDPARPPDTSRATADVRDFVTACLDYLAFGKQATGDQVGKRAAFRTAYVSLDANWRNPVRFEGGYPDPVPVWPLDAGWRRVFAPGAFDAVLFGTKLEADGPEAQAVRDSLQRAKADIEAYFNRGGKLFAMAQSSYGFLPRIDIQHANVYSLSRFTITPAGHAIGLKDWSSTSQMLSYRLNRLDTAVFKVFDQALENGAAWYPITAGFQGFIEDTAFVPVVQRPRSSVPSGSFTDSLCVDFSTATEGAVLVYTLDGTPPGNLSPRLDNPGRLCFHATTTLRILGRKVRWKDSPDTTFTFTLKQPPQPTLPAAKPVASIPSGTFSDSVCVTFSSATPGATLHMSPDGRAPDSASPRLPPSGTWCFRQSATVSLVAAKPGMKTSDTAVFTYVLKPPRPPSALALFAEGVRIDVVTSDHFSLEVRLARAAGSPCSGCAVRVSPSGGADRETVPLAGQGGTFQGTFLREESGTPVSGDGRLQHLPGDSLVLVWINPEDPADSVRRAFPYRGAGDAAAIRPLNDIARTGSAPAAPEGRAFILSDAAGLGDKPCCLIANSPVSARSPDSLRLVGLLVEASRGFTLDLKVFSHLGEPVHRAALAVTEEEFRKLSPVPGKRTRFLRLLWNGNTQAGTRAGNGVYVFKASVALSPAPGGTAAPPVSKASLRFGILR